jgi:hypothetical protein
LSRGESSAFRISSGGQEPVIDVRTVEGIEPAIRATEPVRYHGYEITRDPLPSGHMPRRWRVGIKLADGSVTFEPVMHFST